MPVEPLPLRGVLCGDGRSCPGGQGLTAPSGVASSARRQLAPPHQEVTVRGRVTSGRGSFVRPVHASSPHAVPYLVEPQLGNWQTIFDEAIASFATSPDGGRAISLMMLDELLETDSPARERNAAALAFVLSLVIDIVDSGGRVAVRDSCLWVQWPAWDGSDPSHRAKLRNALERLKPTSERGFVPTSSLKDALPFLAGMELEVVGGDSKESAEVFRRGITTWSMPYRGREGRARRLVVFGRLGRARHPIGLLEVGDDAPHSPTRDAMCGFCVDPGQPDTKLQLRTGYWATFAEWLTAQGRPVQVLDSLAERLAAIRSALRPVEGYETIAPLAQLSASLPHVRAASAGRLGAAAEVATRKRLAYLARLVAGELAFRQRRYEGTDVREGLRALHDLTVPRIHLEATVCGALPPYGPLLVGKLVAGQLAHPLVRSLLDRDVGVITRSLFDDSIERLLPRHGAVLITTKGLFAGHSAQYNRASIVGLQTSIPLAHVADTVGTTTSLLSDRTARLAELLLRHDADCRAISREYGSGGGKRQRTIESAALSSGLPEGIVHARIRRPVYAASFVSNLPNVALLNEDPQWLIDPDETPASFERRSLAAWRDRWLPVAQRRLG